MRNNPSHNTHASFVVSVQTFREVQILGKSGPPGAREAPGFCNRHQVCTCSRNNLSEPRPHPPSHCLIRKGSASIPLKGTGGPDTTWGLGFCEISPNGARLKPDRYKGLTFPRTLSGTGSLRPPKARETDEKRPHRPTGPDRNHHSHWAETLNRTLG